MRNLNLDPFWRTSIGFDRLFDLIDQSLRFEPEDDYPPCNILRTGEDTYRISLAVAGFKPEQIEVSVQQNVLTITGRANDKQDDDYLHRGIAGRSFVRRFSLADYVEVKSAICEDGLLRIRACARAAGSPEAPADRGANRQSDGARRGSHDRAQSGLAPQS